MRIIFLSPDGRIRLLWRLVLYFALFLAIAAIAHYGIRHPLSEELGVPLIWGNLIFAVFYIAATMGLTRFFRSRVDRKPWNGIALGAFRDHWKGFLGGLILAAGMTGLIFFIGEANGGMLITGVEPQPLDGWTVVVFLLAVAVSNFAIGFAEELSMRGYIFQNSAEQFPVWFAVLLNGWIFGAGHFTSKDFSILIVLLMPLVVAFLAFARLWTGSIWLAIGWHTGWNFLQSDVLGIAGKGLWKVNLSDMDAWGGNQMLVLILADAFFLVLVLTKRIRLRGKLGEDGSQEPAVPPAPPVEILDPRVEK
jgi:membrane protease YdiL (CAAX protease family)